MIAWNLHCAFRAKGLDAWMAVGDDNGERDHIRVIPNKAARSTYSRFVLGWEQRLREIGNRRDPWPIARRVLRVMAEPQRRWKMSRGFEDFDHPGTWKLLDLAGDRPGVVHGHILHGSYFDLRVLPWLSRQIPTVITMHDAWLLSGHCAHSFDCEKWMSGCGSCPDLASYPGVPRDATAENWKRKRDIFRQSSLYVVTPCEWLMDKVRQSVFAPAIRMARVIPNGVDVRIFRPGSKSEARRTLDLPQEALIFCFAANGIKRNSFKDWQTLKRTLEKLGTTTKGTRLIFLAIGEDGPAEQVGNAEIRFVPFTHDRGRMAQYYQAADVYVHAALADTFPNVILEAMACGLPVVATDVGGIKEIIQHERSGLLVERRNPDALAAAVARLLADSDEVAYLGNYAARDVLNRFTLDMQVSAHLDFYREAQVDFQNRPLAAVDGCEPR